MVPPGHEDWYEVRGHGFDLAKKENGDPGSVSAGALADESKVIKQLSWQGYAPNAGTIS
jgi:hypothetical protein